ncbi:unnamed protein product [Paramecium sonneborni]|uniref:Uncharacterized protein n=1 Tax=Paramecium sonneborni TaxID=65129 RepID=A0A8S1LBY5_9CILI|nr:unnamed protein product [Paramecium sonneborni]
MNQEQSYNSYLKLKIKEQKIDSLNFEDQFQDFSLIKVIKQHLVDLQEKNQNIQNLIVAISNLYYAIYSIKDKRNISMLHQIQIKQNEENSFHNEIKNIIQMKKDFIQQLSQNEKKKYTQAIDWTKYILSNQHEFADFFLHIKQVILQLKNMFLHKRKSHLLVLLQNQNEKFNKFLYTFCFIQNIKLEQGQDQEQNIAESQLLKTEDDINNENLQEFDHRSKRNLYINITSDIKQQDIDFWSFFMKDYKENTQLIILHPLVQGQNGINTKQDYKLRSNTRNEQLVPIHYIDKVEYYQVKMIYKSILDQKIQNFNPDLIVLEYLLSKKFKLDLQALEYIVRQLQQKAKLIIHFRISTEENFSEYELFSNLNAIIMGLQGFKKLEKNFISETNYEGIVNWTFHMMSILNESFKISNLSLQSELQLISIQNQNQKKIFGCLSLKNIFQWIENKNFQNQSYQHFVFEEVIVLYDKINGDIYYYDRKLMNSDQNSLEIEFNKIELKSQLVEPSIIVLQNYLIIAYGHQQNKEFSDQILLYDLKNQCQNPIVMDRDIESAEFKPIYCDNKKQIQIANLIKNRRGPQICKNNLFDPNNQNALSFILIGGEEKDSILIMNIIEVVILNLRNQKFCSYIVNGQSLSKVTSLKPWPYQIVLECKQQNSCFYLVLNGNQTKKQNYFSFPKNPQYLKQAQLLVQQQNSFQLFILPMKLIIQRSIVPIDELFDECKCQYFDQKQSEENCFVWKLLITRFILFHNSLINHPLFDRFKKILQSLKGDAFLQICFQVKIKLILQVQDSKTQNYQDSRVEVDCQVLEIFQKNI